MSSALSIMVIFDTKSLIQSVFGSVNDVSSFSLEIVILKACL